MDSIFHTVDIFAAIIIGFFSIAAALVVILYIKDWKER